ncbi:MAG: ribose-5-phosphate isomerase RpiA [Candidatus Bathyarchaeia archaeon]
MKARGSSWIEQAKKRAALEAVKHVKNGYVMGLGSGSTAAYAIKEIGKMTRQKNWQILGVPTSYQAMQLATEHGIKITTLQQQPQLDLTIDGADQIDKELNLIKGMGGALTREKIVASASKRVIIVADETKLVNKLGRNHPVPVEVLPFATSTVMLKIRKMKGKPRLRETSGKVGPLVTDNGNFILDADFGPIDAPSELNFQLKSIPGVVETGIFADMADIVYLGTKSAVRKLRKS